MDLTSGDVVERGGERMVFLFASRPHPRYPGLWLVVWGSFDPIPKRWISPDALNPMQVVGRLVRAGEDLSQWLGTGTLWKVEKAK